ncbi:MAG: spermidine/putrescine ABC transporter substrate-binding protein [Bryobacterales bacterium]|nr:spermidine/putrescine ABC transporter substrate-binding protein [Bryobacterales bacterium]
MRRRHFLPLLAGAASACRRSARRLYVYNWSEYVAPETIPDFEREFHVEVRYAEFESNEELLAKVFAGNSGWDVVFPSHYFIPPMVENGLLTPLDHARLPNLANLALTSPPWDPRLAYCAPYMIGAAGILYNPKLIAEPASWNALWDPAVKGRITMLDDPADTLGAALKRSGRSLNATRPADLLHARDELIRQKPLVRAYLNAEARDQVMAGDLIAAHLWTTTSLQAIAEAEHLRFLYPREGFAEYCDCAVILRECRNPELAHEFVNYLLRPEVAARIAQHTATATANAAARRLLPPELRESEILYPSPETAARGEYFATLPAAAQQLRDRVWTEVKAA